MFSGCKHVNNVLISVTLYKCPLMASDCSTCLSFKQVYNCFWCSNQCTNPISLCQTSENCPNPDITNVSTGSVITRVSIVLVIPVSLIRKSITSTSSINNANVTSG